MCRLRRSIYGLKQTPKRWNEAASSALLAAGFTSTSADTCLYVQVKNEIQIFILLYVDDMLVMSSSLQAIQEAKSILFRTFTMKDLGPVDTFLGLRITRDRGLRRMWLSQAGYVQDMQVELGMEHSKPVATPELTSSGSSSPTSSTLPYQPPGNDVSLPQA